MSWKKLNLKKFKEICKKAEKLIRKYENENIFYEKYIAEAKKLSEMMNN